jgi:hypothetical protein
MLPHRYHVTLRSSNRKTGPMTVVTSSKSTCPSICALKGHGCYAESGPLNIVWTRLNSPNAGLSFEHMVQVIRNLPDGSIWRYGQAGDLPGDGLFLDADAIKTLVEASQGKRGYTYTHYSPTVNHNANIIQYANANGFTINMSADNLWTADEYHSMKIGPVVSIVPRRCPDFVDRTIGNPVIVCGSQVDKYMTCCACQRCMSPQRTGIVGFRIHGSRPKLVEAIYNRGYTNE